MGGVGSLPFAFFDFSVFTNDFKYTGNNTTDTPINPHVINQLS